MKNIIENNKSGIRAIIKKFTGSYNDDIEQAVYIKIWQSWKDYRESGKLKQWIGAITANVCRDYFRSKQHKQNDLLIHDDEVLDAVAVEPQQEKTLDAKQRQKAILKAVDSLPRKMRQVVILFEFEELTYAQISKKIGQPVGTVKSRLFNARKILTEKLNYLRGE